MVDGDRYGLAGLNLDGFALVVSPTVPPFRRDAALQAAVWGRGESSDVDLALSALNFEEYLRKRKDGPTGPANDLLLLAETGL